MHDKAGQSPPPCIAFSLVPVSIEDVHAVAHTRADAGLERQEMGII